MAGRLGLARGGKVIEDTLRIDILRLANRLDQLSEKGGLEGGGVSRLALSKADKAGRDLVCSWMKELGLELHGDAIGNVIGVRPGKQGGRPVMTGSHIDTVARGGNYDGCLGVLAGLEVVETLNQAGLQSEYPLAVAFFTNEEGARFAPDMMGSSFSDSCIDQWQCNIFKGSITGKQVECLKNETNIIFAELGKLPLGERVR